jgi:HEAT repeat protein
LVFLSNSYQGERVAGKNQPDDTAILPSSLPDDGEVALAQREEVERSDATAELFRRIDSSVSELESISEARNLVGKWLADAFNRGELTVDDLASQLADPSVSVMARVIYAEAMLGWFSEQIREIDNTPIALTLADVHAPVLSTLIIDVLAHSAQPELMPFIADTAEEPVENIRLAAIRAATAFPDSEVSKRSVVSFLEDEENFKVRSGAIQALSKIDPESSFPIIIEALENEGSSIQEPAPVGQSRQINYEIVTASALLAAQEINSEESVIFRIDVLKDRNHPQHIRKLAAQTLAGVAEADAALEHSILGADEGVRLHAARAYMASSDSQQRRDFVKRGIEITSDRYVAEQLSRLISYE